MILAQQLPLWIIINYPQYERLRLKTPIYFSSLNGKVSVKEEIITKLPLEFMENAKMSWKLIKIEGRQFDAILGQNILKPLGAIVNKKNLSLYINGCIIKFIKYCPGEIFQLKITNINEKVLDNLFQDNKEKLSLDNILVSNSDLIYFNEQNQIKIKQKQLMIVRCIRKCIGIHIYMCRKFVNKLTLCYYKGE